MERIAINCPYCSARQDVERPAGYSPFYAHCPVCSRRFIAEPVEGGMTVYRDGEAPCCSDPECREIEMGDSGQD